MKKYQIDRITNDDLKKLAWKCLEEENNDITETAGFIPLQIKFKKFQEQGILLQFQQNEFTSSDLRELYNSPDFEIYPDDELEEIQEKLINRQKFINNVIQNKAPVVNDNNINNEQQKPILSENKDNTEDK